MNESTVSAVDSLDKFFANSCLQYQPDYGSGCQLEVISLSVARPVLHEEFTHERAFSFLFADEMKVVRQLQKQYQHGRDLYMKAYCTRSCSRAIPLPIAETEGNLNNVMRYYSAVYKVLKLSFTKLSMLCTYCTQTTLLLSDTIQRIAAQENTHRLIPDILLDSIVNVMDIVVQMNHLYDTKKGLQQDFLFFKRAFKHVQGDLNNPEQVAREIHRVEELVGHSSHSCIWESLRLTIKSVKRYDQVIVLILKHCIHHMESDRWALPNDRFKFIRVLPCLVALLESENHSTNTSNVSSSSIPSAMDKRLIETSIKILARYPAVPIFADMVLRPTSPFITPIKVLAKLDSIQGDIKHWDPLYDLIKMTKRAKEICAQYIPKLVFEISKISPRSAATSETDDKTSALIVLLIQEAMRYLSEWKASILLFLSTKYQTPKSNEQLEHMDNPYIEYERAIKHNLSDDECLAMIELIHAIKSISQLLRQYQVLLTPYLRHHVYITIQSFIQHTLVPILHRADKRKHVATKILQDIRLMCGDWISEFVPADDYKRKRKDRILPNFRPRCNTCVTPSQLQMLRTAIQSIATRRTATSSNDGDTKASGSIFNFQRELKSGDIETLEQFYMDTMDLDVLIEVYDTLNHIDSFSDLWFRERYLELTESPQMPIENSLPWILLKRIFRMDTIILPLRSVLSIIDIYNDVATTALQTVQQRCIYDEVDAEATLFFDHLVFLMAEVAFTTAKNNAAKALLGTECITRLDRTSAGKDTFIKESTRRISEIARVLEHTIQVLHRSVDLTLLVSKQVGLKFMQDLWTVFEKLKAVDMTLVVATKYHLNMLEHAHQMLDQCLILDAFELMRRDANDQLRMTTSRTRSRFSQTITTSVIHDLCRHYGYNHHTQRFFRTPIPLELRPYLLRPRDPQSLDGSIDRESVDMAKEYGGSAKALSYVGLDRECRVGFDLLHRAYRGFVGRPHMEALVSLSSVTELLEIVEECLEFISGQMEGVLELCLPVIGSAIPPYRFPKLLYRVEGCYGFFDSKFKHMMDSKELEAHVFHCLREIGNTLLFVMLLSQVLDVRHTSLAHKSSTITGLFPRFLQRMYQLLIDMDWSLQWNPPNMMANPEKVENPSSFFLVWNALEFVSCCAQTTKSNNCTTYREQYGEGIYFAGCTILHLLQQRSLYELWNPSQYILDVYEHDQVKKNVVNAVKVATHSRKLSSTTLAAFKSNSTNITSPTSPTMDVSKLDPEMIENTRVFVTQASQMKVTMSSMFSILEAAWSPPTSGGTKQFSPSPPVITSATTPNKTIM